MEIDVRDEGPVTLIRLSGDLDATMGPRLTEELDRLWTAGRRRFVLDLHAVPFVDSAGLSVLVRLFKRVRAQTGRLGLAALQPPVRRVFELTRLERSFDVYPDVAEALRRAGG
jgi:anti-sigma B factor antagonist